MEGGDASDYALGIPAGYAKSLSGELDRAHAGIQGRLPHVGNSTIPVHYLLEGCERADCRAAIDALLEGLLAAGRVTQDDEIIVRLRPPVTLLPR